MYVILTAVAIVEVYRSFKTLFAFTVRNRKRKGKINFSVV